MNDQVLGEMTIRGLREFVGPLRHVMRDLVLAVHPQAAETAELLTSEVLGNALLHTPSGEPGGTVRLLLEADLATITISITDLGSGPNHPTVTDDPLGINGRGLQLVELLAKDWGAEMDEHETTVWFTIAADQRTDALV